LLIIVLFSALVYFLPQQKNSDPKQTLGMAKETAHQIARHFLP
jgi:hypothetical protein